MFSVESFAASTGLPASMGPFDILVIGASFGGPKAVETILTKVPRHFRLPIAICQHITPGMTEHWAERLNNLCAIDVVEVRDGLRLEPGTAYIAPAGYQTRIMRTAIGGRLRLDPDFADSLHVPSVDMLFSSAAQQYGSCALGVLLTGLGSDGATGMLAIRNAGGYTIGESEATAASYSMPGAAAGLGAVVEQLPLDRIADRVIELGRRGQ